MSNKLPYSHLMYVRQYSIIDNDDILDETTIDKSKFSFSEYKHYLNMKRN